MVKLDLASAHQNVAIHPDDRLLLGMQWRGKYFVDMVLPFRSHSAAFIFTSIADLVEWIVVHNYSVDFFYATTWMTFLPLVHRHPSSATPTYLPVFAFAKGLACPFILTS